jgi:hypothetical protein
VPCPRRTTTPKRFKRDTQRPCCSRGSSDGASSDSHLASVTSLSVREKRFTRTQRSTAVPCRDAALRRVVATMGPRLIVFPSPLDTYFPSSLRAARDHADALPPRVRGGSPSNQLGHFSGPSAVRSHDHRAGEPPSHPAQSKRRQRAHSRFGGASGDPSSDSAIAQHYERTIARCYRARSTRSSPWESSGCCSSAS